MIVAALVALGSLQITAGEADTESYVLPITRTNGYRKTDDPTHSDPATRVVWVIQMNGGQKCIRRIARHTVTDKDKKATIDELPVSEATKAIIAQELANQNSDNPETLQGILNDDIYYSDCSTSHYELFEAIKKGSNIISEIPVKTRRNDVRKKASNSLASYCRHASRRANSTLIPYPIRVHCQDTIDMSQGISPEKRMVDNSDL